jgi:hypothetical protein
LTSISVTSIVAPAQRRQVDVAQTVGHVVVDGEDALFFLQEDELGQLGVAIDT